MHEEKAKNTNVKITLLFIFAILASSLFFLLEGRKNCAQKQHLQFITDRYVLAYNTIYDQYRQLATIVFSEIVERFDIQDMYQLLLMADEEQKNRLREKLYLKINSRYEELCNEGKIRQLHFHLKNNESFLRLHRPEKFGDNLTDIRETVNYVNTFHLPIDGFEEGRIYNGYRFVFPLTAIDQTHQGSMEVSFGPEVLTSSMMKQYSVLSNFFIKEETMKRKVFPDEQNMTYEKSHHEGYLYDNNVLAILKAVSIKEMKDLKPSKKITDRVYANAHSGQAASLYDSSIDLVITTIPVLNPVTHEMIAIFTVRSRSDFFINEIQHFRVLFSLSLLLLAGVFSAFYLQLKKSNILQQEIDERRCAEQALSESEQRHRQIFETSADAMIILNEKGEIVAANPSAYKIYGYEGYEMIGLAARDFVHPDFHVMFERFVKKLSNGERFQLEAVGLRKNGKKIDVEVRGTPIVLKGEIHLLAIVRDISERKQNEAELTRYREQLEKQVKVRTLELKEQKEQLQAITENVPGVVFQFYASNTGVTGFHYVSPKLFEIFEIESTDDPLLFMQIFSKNIYEEDRQSWDDSVRETIKDQIPWKWKGRYVKPSGAIIWFEGQSTPTVRKDEIVFDGIFVDITKKIEQEGQRLEATRQQEQLKKLDSLKTMAGAIAHRFNNAMMAVQGNLELIALTLPEYSDEHKMAANASLAARGASQVGSMMLSYVGQRPLKLQKLSLVTLTRESVSALRKRYDSVISIKFNQPTQPLYCSMDPKQIHEVIESILMNAVESLEEKGGKISISLGRDRFVKSSFPIPFQGEYLQDGMYTFCEIKDTGHGISPENISRIFEPFYTTRFVGRGLGLALTVGIMQSHRGAITVESFPDKGTTVRVLLPFMDSSREIVPVSMEEDNTAQVSGDILLADDEEMVLEVGGMMLEALGYTVHKVINGQEAVDKVRKKDVDFCVVMLDISMPEMDGIEAMQEIRKINPVLPVILSSGYSEDDFSYKKELGGKPDAFLNKPFQLSEIQNILKGLCS